jgi:hypothetical protein
MCFTFSQQYKCNCVLSKFLCMGWQTFDFINSTRHKKFENSPVYGANGHLFWPLLDMRWRRNLMVPGIRALGAVRQSSVCQTLYTTGMHSDVPLQTWVCTLWRLAAKRRADNSVHSYARAVQALLCTRPAFADKPPLVDSPWRPKTESQNADLAWAHAECDMPHFLGWYTSPRSTDTLTLRSDASSYTANENNGLHDTIHATGMLWECFCWPPSQHSTSTPF